MNACTVIPLVGLNGRVKFPNVLRAEAQDFRKDHPGACVIVFRGTQIIGSASDLSSPSRFVAGDVAVTPDEKFYEARGCDAAGRATEWARVRS